MSWFKRARRGTVVDKSTESSFISLYELSHHTPQRAAPARPRPASDKHHPGNKLASPMDIRVDASTSSESARCVSGVGVHSSIEGAYRR